MATLEEVFAQAWEHHRAGRVSHAQQLYLHILQADPGHANAHHLLGVTAYQSGQFDQAVASIRRAIELNPREADYHCNLGLACEALGQLEEAATSFEQALRLQPCLVEALGNLGNIRLRQARLDEAATHYNHAVRLRPNYAEAHCGLGLVLAERRKVDQAVASFRQALQIKPDYADAHNNWGKILLDHDKPQEAVAHYEQALRLRPDFPEAKVGLGNALVAGGNALLIQEKLDEATAWFRRALQLNPEFAEAHNGLGIALERDNKLNEAGDCYRRALELKFDFAEACNNLGNVYSRQDNLDEAMTWYREALRLNPDYAGALYNLGNCLTQQKKLEEALKCYDRALQLKPRFALAHWNRAFVWLLRGDFQNGWPEYEWRWAQAGVVRRQFAQPRWDGAPLQGRTILLYAEQGLGDTLQFVRYLPLVKRQGGQVLLECQPQLVRLLAGAQGMDRVIPAGCPLPAFDVHAPLLSLPGIFQTTLETIPATLPYLNADADLVEYWRRELGPLGRFKVGIAWQGQPTFRFDRQRSIPLTQFAPLARVPGVQLISLQKGPGTDQLRALAGRFQVLDLSSRLDEANGAFMDTAAVMGNLDAVVSSDTAVPHLAGALGVPVWLALPLVPDWRWLLHRPDSPWYPCMRLFRQKCFGQWENVFDRVADELQVYLARLDR